MRRRQADRRPGGEMARLAWCRKDLAGLRERQWCRIEELDAASTQRRGRRWFAAEAAIRRSAFRRPKSDTGSHEACRHPKLAQTGKRVSAGPSRRTSSSPKARPRRRRAESGAAYAVSPRHAGSEGFPGPSPPRSDLGDCISGRLELPPGFGRALSQKALVRTCRRAMLMPNSDAGRVLSVGCERMEEAVGRPKRALALWR
jgi:hypothetical protein